MNNQDAAIFMLAAFTATGVIGPGVAGIDLIHKNPKPVVERQAAEEPPAPARPIDSDRTPSGVRASEKQTTARSEQNGAAKRAKRRADEVRTKQADSRATSQFGIESGAQATAPMTSAPTTTQTTPAPASAPTPDQSAQQQFGLP